MASFDVLLQKVVPRENKYRFYKIVVVQGLFGDWALMREWGRIGRHGTVRSEWYERETEAEKAASFLLEKRRRRGYVCREDIKMNSPALSA